MATLTNFPIVSQLTDITSDGRPSENKQYDCVAASIGACLLWYEGKSQWDQQINPDRLKDIAYGEAFRNNGTEAVKYVDFCQSLGYKLYPINGIPGQLIQHIHEQLEEEHPVVFTEPDPYVSASLGWSHVCVFYADTPGELTLMDPYIAKSITRSDTEWLNMLLFNQIWIVERSEETVIIDLNNPDVSKYYELANAQGTQWRCRANGKIIQFGILDFYKKFGNNALCGLTFLGLPLSNEIPLQGVAGAVKQFFERGCLIYDPQHVNDNPPGSGSVYPAHLYEGVAQDPRLADLQAKLAALPDDTKLQQDLQAALARIDKIRAVLA